MNKLAEMKLNSLKEEAAFYEKGLKTCESYEKEFYAAMAKGTKENVKTFQKHIEKMNKKS